ncbi:hypothetical protein JTE90_009081 [Oedothorax gibbosus]|uniref:DNA polymerase alpha subunit B n=1 Tax=Oedothorax gibbosus TaxID=931172 RepID=A0AAV6V219_9ARAC|nr:hypothetical protein JTE90_009081 [Oedothorax gibbosus]
MDSMLQEISLQLEDYCLNAEEQVLSKMKELCFVYHFSAEDIVAQWVSFSSSKGACEDPTIPKLEHMEKEELISQKQKKRKSTTSSVSTPTRVYNSSTIDHIGSDGPENKQETRSQLPSLDQSPLFSTDPRTPSNFTPSRKYGARTGSGDPVSSFGALDNVEWKQSDEFSCSIYPYSEKTALRTTYKFMSEKFRDIASILNDMIQDAAEDFVREHSIEEWGHIQLPSVEAVPVIGRIVSDGEKLNPSSLLLEGSIELSSGHTVPLDVSRLEKFSFFPGQIIAGTGINNLGKKLVMHSLYEGIYPEVHPKSPDLANCFDSLGVVIAAGPFATSDTMSYEPLWDLMKYVKIHKPHVVILIGPFVDSKNAIIENGELNEYSEDVFKNMLTELLKHIEHLSTKVVLVPSTRDIHHESIYPTPPFSVERATKRLYLASDPCILNIEGVVFAITSTDILLHLGKEEISHPQQPDRLGRLCKHILTQKHFYPLHPPHEDLNVDSLHCELHASLPVMPHVLVVPSDFRQFIKDVNGCCCINPERLTKHSSGGTFARLKINSIDKEKYKGNIIDSIQAQVIKI